MIRQTPRPDRTTCPCRPSSAGSSRTACWQQRAVSPHLRRCLRSWFQAASTRLWSHLRPTAPTGWIFTPAVGAVLPAPPIRVKSPITTGEAGVGGLARPVLLDAAPHCRSHSPTSPAAGRRWRFMRSATAATKEGRPDRLDSGNRLFGPPHVVRTSSARAWQPPPHATWRLATLARPGVFIRRNMPSSAPLISGARLGHPSGRQTSTCPSARGQVLSGC